MTNLKAWEYNLEGFDIGKSSYISISMYRRGCVMKDMVAL